MPATRVLIAIKPSMYAEALAFSVRKRRPRAEVALLGPSEDLEAGVRRTGPHLIVANRVPSATRADRFWVEVAEPVEGGGPKTLGALISADGYSRSVDDVRTEHVLVALDRAEELLLDLGHAQGAGVS